MCVFVFGALGCLLWQQVSGNGGSKAEQQQQQQWRRTSADSGRYYLQWRWNAASIGDVIVVGEDEH